MECWNYARVRGNINNWQFISIDFLVSPIIGGILSNPATRWPRLTHPYLLPCLVTGIVAFLTFVTGFVGLKEVSI